MLDTPNSYLEVERRESFLGILGRGLGRREDFEVVDSGRFNGPWLPFTVVRARLAIVRTCIFDDCAVRFGSSQIAPGAVVSKHVKIHCSGYTFRSISVSRLRRFCSREARRRCVKGWHVGDLEMSHLIFRLSELYTNLGHILRSRANRSPWTLVSRRRTRLWSDVGFQFLQSKSISTDFTAWRCYHVSCTLSAPSHRCIPTSLPTSTGPTPSSGFTPGFGMAVSQNTLRLFLAQDGRGKS